MTTELTNKLFSALALVCLLSACAHNPPATPDVTDKPAVGAPENLTLPNGDEITAQIVPFNEKEGTPVGATELMPHSRAEEFACSDHYLASLIVSPHEEITTLKNIYDLALESNKAMKEIIALTLKVQFKILDVKTYGEKYDSLNQRIDEINKISAEQFYTAQKLQTSTRLAYGMCSEKFSEVLKAKDVDKNQDGCEYAQFYAYLFDPYGLRQALSNAFELEASISTGLSQFYQALEDEILGKSTAEETQQKAKQVEELFRQDQLDQRSRSLFSEVMQAYSSTFSVKKACEEANRKKGVKAK